MHFGMELLMHSIMELLIHNIMELLIHSFVLYLEMRCFAIGLSASSILPGLVNFHGMKTLIKLY